ncbi:MAG TPA: hypothetical protein VGO59_20625 [Verrucomicrobiae bacterium]
MNNMTHLNSEFSKAPTLWRVASLSTAGGLGCALGSTASLRCGAEGFSFQFSLAAVIATALGIAIGLLYWKLEAGGAAAGRNGRVLLALTGAGLFLYPLRLVPASILPDIATGLAAAVCALSLVSVMLLLVKRFLDSEERI